MTRHLFASALFAGLAAGCAAALLQFAFVVPLLLEGELYETGARVHFEAGAAQSPAGAPPLSGDLGRHLGTLAFNFLAYTGFALLMVVAMGLAQRRGHVLTARNGLVWGLAGFVAVQLAPAAGLPPELPGTAAAALAARQLWWVGCVVASLAGIALVAFGRGPAPVVGGALALALPHLVGAPTLDTYFGIAPPELSAHFATRSLAVAAVSWAVLGAVAAGLMARRA